MFCEQIPGCGRGVVATAAIKKGDIVLQVEAYGSGKTFKDKLFSVLERRAEDGPEDGYFNEHVLGLCDQGKPDADFQNDDLLATCKELAPDLSEDTLRSLYDKLDTNMFQHGLFVECAFCNHSCDPNLNKVFSKDKKVLSLEANRDIERGEECFITYFNKKELAEPVFSRRARTEAVWGFTCFCARCLRESSGVG